MADKTRAPRPPMRPGLRALLIGSLAVNLVVLGLAAGAMMGNKRIGDRPPKDVDVIGAYTRALAPEDRRAIGRAIRDHARANGQGRDAIRRHIEDTLVALRASPFDAQQMKQLLDGQNARAFERRTVVQELWLERLETMSDAERSAFADRVEEAMRKRSGPKGSKGPKPN